MKKLIVTLSLIVSLFTTQSLMPQRANAVAGVIAMAAGGAGVPLMITGGALVGAGVVIVAVPSKHSGGDINFDGVFKALIGVTVAIVGLVVLDDKQVLAPSFSTLSDEQARKIGLSDAEHAAYEDSLDDINAATQTVTKETLSDGKPTLEKAAAAWGKVKGDLDADAYSAVVKISQNMHKQVVESTK